MDIRVLHRRCERFQLCMEAAAQEGVDYLLREDRAGFARVRDPYSGQSAQVRLGDEAKATMVAIVCPMRAVMLSPEPEELTAAKSKDKFPKGSIL